MVTTNRIQGVRCRAVLVRNCQRSMRTGKGVVILKRLLRRIDICWWGKASGVWRLDVGPEKLPEQAC